MERHCGSGKEQDEQGERPRTARSGCSRRKSAAKRSSSRPSVARRTRSRRRNSTSTSRRRDRRRDPSRSVPAHRPASRQGDAGRAAAAPTRERRGEGDGDGAEGGRTRGRELVAAECAVEAETKDHENWELFGRGEPRRGHLRRHSEKRRRGGGAGRRARYHTMGWARGLGIESLGSLRAPLAALRREEGKNVIGGVAREVVARRDGVGTSPQTVGWERWS